MSKLINFVLGFVATTVLAFTLFIGMTGCGALSGALKGDVLTDEAYVPEGTPVVATTLPVKNEAGDDTGRVWVIVAADALPDSAPRVPLGDAPKTPMEDSGVTGALGSLLWGTPVGPFVPLVGYVLTKLLAARRPRQHATAAIKALARANVVEAVTRLAKAEGVLHSTKASERTAEATDPALTPKPKEA